MPRTYTPGPEADAVVDQLLAMGRYGSPDEVVRACIDLLQRHDAAREELLRLGDQRIARLGSRPSPAKTPSDE